MMWRPSRRIRTSSSSARRRAACSRASTTESRGGRCSMATAQRCRSATSRSPRPIPISCGSAPAKRTIARALRGEMAFTNQWTAAKPGSTWACVRRTTSAVSSCIRKTPTSSTWRRWVTSGDPMRSAACIARAMAGSRGRRCSASTTIPASATWRSIRTAGRCSRRHISGVAAAGASSAAARAAVSTAASTAARRGKS